MAFLEIKKYPDPVLREKAKEVPENTEEIKGLKKDMVETMIKANGVGLAAPQVGQSKRVIIVQTEKEPLELLNPRIIKKSKETEVFEEGCLSLPGLWFRVKRAKEVEVRAQDKEGREVQITAKDFQARIFQHEVDHLNGILIFDRIGFFERLKLKFFPKKL